jgi:glycosyltransferase involved in cell wall biosynthesis
MVKVIVQVPCLNEEETLPLVLESIPKKIKGVDSVEVLIIDDGSTDKTVAVAKKYGVKHFVYHKRNMGLGRSFHDGVEKALELGADILVNTDGDNQYPQDRIGDLVQPIIAGKAEIVIADRQVSTVEHFSPTKKLLQHLGSNIVNWAAGTNVPDAASGFRAYSRESLIQLNTISRFSYCMETIIQAGSKRLAIASIPVKTNPKLRESRLFHSMWEHVLRSGMIIIRAYTMYNPYTLFSLLGSSLLVLGLIPYVRYGILTLIHNHPGNHLQSLIFGAVLILAAIMSFVLGVLADLIRTNRVLSEDALERIKRMQFDSPQNRK